MLLHAAAHLVLVEVGSFTAVGLAHDEICPVVEILGSEGGAVNGLKVGIGALTHVALNLACSSALPRPRNSFSDYDDACSPSRHNLTTLSGRREHGRGSSR